MTDLAQKQSYPEKISTEAIHSLSCVQSPSLQAALLQCEERYAAHQYWRASSCPERLLGEQAPSSRLLLGADSQVALGTLIKGRATSRAPVHTLDAGTGCLSGTPLLPHEAQQR